MAGSIFEYSPCLASRNHFHKPDRAGWEGKKSDAEISEGLLAVLPFFTEQVLAPKS